MPAEWLQVRYQDGITCVGMVAGYGITIVGSPGLWSWFIDLDGRSFSEGVERNLAAALTAAEDEAHRLADDPGEP